MLIESKVLGNEKAMEDLFMLKTIMDRFLVESEELGIHVQKGPRQLGPAMSCTTLANDEAEMSKLEAVSLVTSLYPHLCSPSHVSQ